jgi:molybdopterin-guanine dinucleotide biosynthesis protein A
MLLNVIDTALQISQDIIIATKPERINKYKKIINKQIKIISDDPPIKDSMLLAGVNAGIQHLQNEYILIIAGDMPFIKPEVIKILIDNMHQNDVTVPIYPNGITQPLLAIYKREHIQKSIKTILKKEQNRATDLIRNAYTIKFISTDEIKRVDPELKSLTSINKPTDIQNQTSKQMLNIVKTYNIIFKDPHPYWRALNAYLNHFYQQAGLLFTKEAKIYKEYGITHLELHTLYDALNAYQKIKKDQPRIHQRLHQLIKIIS